MQSEDALFEAAQINRLAKLVSSTKDRHPVSEQKRRSNYLEELLRRDGPMGNGGSD
jgi:hypothetical protein